MKDLFSTDSASYAQFRPKYPDALFNELASRTRERIAAWDCGTGNGQAAVALGMRFDRVYATDLSPAQIKSAEPHHNVVYGVGTAEQSGLRTHSVNLITVAQAYHWFDHAKFIQEAKRVGQPGALVAIWCYALMSISPEVDRVVNDIYERDLGEFWEPERRYVESGYRDLPFDFQPVKLPAFQMQESWSLGQLLGYLGTWSALKTYQAKRGGNPVMERKTELQIAWGSELKRTVTWPLSVRAGYCPN